MNFLIFIDIIWSFIKYKKFKEWIKVYFEKK